jgi:hypothetical protein
MNAVGSHRVDRMEIRRRLRVRPAEGNVSAGLAHRAARFDTSHEVSPRQALVL